MSHVNFDVDSVDWSSFINRQVGEGEQNKFFIGTKYQRGFGVLSTAGRFLLPIIKNLATSAAAEGITAAPKILKDYSEGKALKDSLVEHGSKGLSNLGERIQQCGKGRRRRPKVIKVEYGIPTTAGKRKRRPDQLDQF